MNLPSRRLLLMSLAALALPFAPAQAQDNWSVIPNDYVMNDILNRQRIEAAIGRPIDGSAPRKTAPAPATKPNGSTRYTATPAVAARVRTQFVQQIRTTAGDEAAQKVGAALNRGDAVKSWNSIVNGDGLRSGDMTDAFASYVVLHWVMANRADSTPAQAMGVRRQVAPVMATYANLPDARKQELAETFMLNFLLQHAAYVDALQRNDTVTQGKLSDAAATRFRKEMGLDLRTLQLSDKGLTPRG